MTPIIITLSFPLSLGDEFQLADGRTAIFDFNDGLHFGITCSDGQGIGFNYLDAVSQWLKTRCAKLVKEGKGGRSDRKDCRICRYFFDQ